MIFEILKNEKNLLPVDEVPNLLEIFFSQLLSNYNEEDIENKQFVKIIENLKLI